MEDTIDEFLYDEIKAASLEGEETSAGIAKDMDIPLETVNNVLSSNSFSSYKEKYGSTKKKQHNLEKVAAPSASYFSSLVAKKHEENSNLKETRSWLMEQVHFLRKTIGFLEVRKRQLEDGIADLEKAIMNGVGTMVILEENEGFLKVGDKMVKKNER